MSNVYPMPKRARLVSGIDKLLATVFLAVFSLRCLLGFHYRPIPVGVKKATRQVYRKTGKRWIAGGLECGVCGKLLAGVRGWNP